MGEFKGTKGKASISFDGYWSIHVRCGDESDVMTVRNFEDGKGKENAKLVVDALNVRQSIDCELPELLDRHNSMLDMLKRVNESLLNDSSTIEQIELREGIELLIKKVEV